MFEKEAEEATLDLYGSADDVYGKEDYKQGFKDGAEFGYNKASEQLKEVVETCNHWQEVAEKANEWHYVKDGDLPKDEDWKWCVSYRGYCYVAKYEEMFGCWTNQEHSEVMQPYAWKEIVLPKENK